MKTDRTIRVELIELVNSLVISLSKTTLLEWLNFLLGSLTVFFRVLHVWQILIMLIMSLLISFKLKDGPLFITQLDYSRADWDDLCEHLRDVSHGIFAYVGIDVYFPYQVRSHSSPWFTAVCAVATAQKKSFL